MQSGRKLLLGIVPYAGLLTLVFCLTPSPRLEAASRYLARQTQLGADGAITITNSSFKERFPLDIIFSLDASDRFAAITSATLFTKVQGSDAVNQTPQPIATPSPTLHVSYLWDTRQKYIAPGSKITFWWELHDAVGARFTSEQQSFNDDDNRFEWKQISQGMITVHWYKGDDTFGHALLSAAVRSLQRIGESFGGVSPQEQITIWNYGSIDDFHSALAPGAYEWVGGQAQPKLNEVLLVISPGDEAEIGRSLPHELDHVLFYQITANPFSPPPPWLDEGLAVYNQEYHPASLKDRLHKAVQERNLIPLQDLNSSFPVDSDQAYLSYAESWSLVQYIFAHYGKEKMTALVATFKEGVTPDQAVSKALGISLAQLDSDWQVSLHLPPTIAKGGQPGQGGITPAQPVAKQAPAIPPFLTGAVIGGVALVLAAAALLWTTRRPQRK